MRFLPSHDRKEDNMRFFIIAVWVTVAVMCAGSTAAYQVRGQVIAGGGTSAPPMSNASHTVYGTVGQAAYSTSANASHQNCEGFWCFGGPRVLAIDDHTPPTQFALGMATPNPTGNETRFHLALPRDARVTLSVYDVHGRRVANAVSHSFAAGEHDLFWKPPGGTAGLYFIRLESDGAFRATRRVIVIH